MTSQRKACIAWGPNIKYDHGKAWRHILVLILRKGMRRPGHTVLSRRAGRTLKKKEIAYPKSDSMYKWRLHWSSWPICQACCRFSGKWRNIIDSVLATIDTCVTVYLSYTALCLYMLCISLFQSHYTKLLLVYPKSWIVACLGAQLASSENLELHQKIFGVLDGIISSLKF